MSFNIRNNSKLKYTVPAGGVGDNFLVVDPSSGEVSFRTPSQVGALAIGGASGDVLYNNAGVIGGFGDWNGTRLEIGGNFKLGEVAQAGSARTITADGSATDVAITLTPKGAGAITAGSATVNVGNTGDTLIDNVSASTNSAVRLRSKGTGSMIVNSPSGNVVLSAGVSSEVVMGESTTAASTRILSAQGSGSNVDIIVKPKGTGTVISEANFTIGSTSLAGSSRTIKSGGSASNVDLILASKGTGNVSLISESPSYGSGVNVVFIPNTATPTSVAPTGGGTLYSSSQNLIWFGTKSFSLTNQIVGKNINSVVSNPTVTENGKALVWDNTGGQYTLGTISASAGGVNTNIQYNSSGTLAGFGAWDGATMTVPGSFQIGDSGTAGTNRNITAEGSVGNVSITLDPKGTANIILAVDGGQVSIGSGSGTTRTLQAIGSATDVSLILSGQGAGVVYTGSNFYIGNTSLAGTDRILAPEGSGSNINLQVLPKGTGNISLFSTTPTYGSGTGVVYIKSATGAPSGSITGGGALYVTSSAIRFVNSSGTDYDLTQTAQVAVRKNSTGGDVGLRRRINFIEGTGVTMTIADDAGNDEVDVTINASGGGMGYTNEEAQDAVGTILTDTSSINFTYDDATPTITADVIADSNVQRVAIRKNSTGGDTGTRRRLNFIESGPISVTLADDGLDNELDITIGSSATTLSGYGITDAWDEGSGAVLTANNTISGAFNIGFTNTQFGIGVAPASITASTRLDVIGISGGNVQRWANDGSVQLMNLTNLGVLTVGGANAGAITVFGSGTTNAVRLNSTQGILLGSSSSNVGFAPIAISGGTFNLAGSGLRIQSNASSDTGGAHIVIRSANNLTATSGNIIGVQHNDTFAPTSGTAVFYLHRLTGTINQTGGANGQVSILRLDPTYTSAVNVTAFDYNPTVTSVTGTHLAIRTTSGQHLFGGTTITAGSVLADFQSSTEGIVVPRPTLIANIASPVNAMVAYDTTTNLFNFRQGGTWVNYIAGAASSTDNAIARFDSTTGKIIQNSSLLINDSGHLTAGTNTNVVIAADGNGVLISGSELWVRDEVSGQVNEIQLNPNIGITTNIQAVRYTGSSSTKFVIQGAPGITGSTRGQDIQIIGGEGLPAGGDAGDVLITSGEPKVSGVEGSVNIQTRTTGKLGFFNVTGVTKITTGVAASTFTANTSGIVDDTATWDGYTMGQIVKALRNYGLLT